MIKLQQGPFSIHLWKKANTLFADPEVSLFVLYVLRSAASTLGQQSSTP
jgi:hypothetical protein